MKNSVDALYEAMLARDHRFDGKFFIGVRTTGIYCRPICPAKPKRENIEFFPNAVAAERAGYRPCLRCRPECAPLSPAWAGTSAVVQRALKLIAANHLHERNEDQFAALLGISARHLRRLFEDEIGKTPKQISDNNRLGFARKLLVETRLSATEIAFMSGFSSIRRFNDAIKERFRRTPTQLRKTSAARKETEAGIRLTLPFRPPFDWEAVLEFFRTHQIVGAEQVTAKAYTRTFRVNGVLGGLRIECHPENPELIATIAMDDCRPLFQVVQRLRQMFDLDSDPLLVTRCFSESKTMGDLRRKEPSLRIARFWDPFEAAVCTILGQLVSTEQACRLVEQLVRGFGEHVKDPLTGASAWLFPTAQALSQTRLTGVKTTASRKNAIKELALRVVQGQLSFEPAQDPAAFRNALLEIKGVGVWTAEYICLRALGDADAFPHSDLILKRATDLHPDLELDQFRPWRGYAAIHLWHEYAKPLSKKGKKTK